MPLTFKKLAEANAKRVEVKRLLRNSTKLLKSTCLTSNFKEKENGT